MAKEIKLGALILAPGIKAVESRRANKARLFNELNAGLEAPKPRRPSGQKQ